MEYLEIVQILKTNKIFKKIEQSHPSIVLDLEVYSCKTSKKQKRSIHVEKPLRYLVETIQLYFTDYDFSDEPWTSFHKISYQDVVNELMYAFMVFYKNREEVMEFVDFLGLIIDKTVKLDDCEIFSYINRNGPFERCNWYFCFLFYTKIQKRVLMLSVRSVTKD